MSKLGDPVALAADKLGNARKVYLRDPETIRALVQLWNFKLHGGALHFTDVVYVGPGHLKFIGGTPQELVLMGGQRHV